MVSFMALGFMAVALLLFAINIITSIWAYRDALHKGNSKEYALLVLLGTLVFPVLGFIIYLIIRKD